MDISYKHFSIPKGRGKWRTIYEPAKELKEWQTSTLQELYKTLPHDCNHGFVPNRSIATNAKPHVGKEWVLSFDIKSFFPNTNEKKVETILTRFFPDWLEYLPRFIYKKHLPQGAPTSPYLANFALWDFDAHISDLCANNEINYTRYADDLTFSYNSNQNTKLLFKEVNTEIKKYGYYLSKKKTHLMPRWRQQKVTGFIVNEKLNLPKNRRNLIRAYNHLNSNGKWAEDDTQLLAGLNGWKGMI